MDLPTKSLCEIIIPIWNNLDLTKRCIQSIRENTSIPYRFILIDNGSSHETRQYLDGLVKDSRDVYALIRNQDNLGYVQAINQGLAQSFAPYVCLMNNDIVVAKGWLERMMEFAESHPQAGLINPQQNHDPSQRYPEDLEAFVRTQIQARGAWEELDHCTGGCLLIKREVIEKVGVLDEGFGIGHWEDNDFSRRAQSAGYQCIRLLDTYVWHAVSSSFKYMDGWKEEASKNERRFYEKWGKPCRILYPVHERFDLRRARFHQIVQTIHALARKGCEVHLLIGRKQSSIAEEILPYYDLWRHENLHIHEVAMLRMSSEQPLRISWDGVFHWASFFKMRKLMHEKPYDAIFTRHLNSAAFLARWKRYISVPLVFEAHEIFFMTTERKEKRKRIRNQEIRTYRKIDGLVTNTQAVAKALKENFSIQAPLEVIPNGVSQHFFRYGQKTGRFRKIIYVGQLYPWKGVGSLIEAMRYIENGELHILGGGKQQVENLKNDAERNGVGDRVSFHGQVPPEQVRKSLAEAAVAVHPLTQNSIDGQFTSPLKLFEYMAAGVPIVASDLPSTREILADGVNALLVSPDDPKALARGIQSLLENPNLAEKLAQKAQKDASSFTWERRAERLLDFFRFVINRQATINERRKPL